MTIHKILTQPWIALTFLLILVFLWLAAWRRDRRDRDNLLNRRAEAEKETSGTDTVSPASNDEVSNRS
jgi:cytochrome oxidase assembly protein ShyY1